ncbi:hypothetical protein [Haloferula rosea]|uniref:Uncharacterized protein n=1 Tax=Haloferula rosea TaxID=490093 RepID=A0A934RAI2_9BACT|nr:hypothetical protein [Haloferula rosea]MBK1827048.1 hypothetical protein [Haloferula rosea]
MLSRTTITTLALALAGGGLWTLSGTKLSETRGFEFQPNPLGIKRSPYGQVLAMAIQTPIDADWHGGLEIHDHAEGGCGGCGDHDHDHHSAPETAEHDHHDHSDCDHGDCGHDHHSPEVAEHDHSDHEDGSGGCGHDHGTDKHADADNKQVALLDRLQSAVSQRTNPNAPTEGHKLYLRKEIEKKLRFAYELDPSHYANYNCYHLFITQRQLGTHGLPDEQVFEMVQNLADYTIRYCLTEKNDPRPALTASSAAYNVLERMLNTTDGEYSFDTMRKQLATMDFCIQRHFELLDSFINDGSFANLSSMRQEEILTRSKFAVKLRDSAQEAINRRERDQTSTADAS